MNELIQKILADKNARTEDQAETLVTAEDAFDTCVGRRTY
jgi:hypothetical protein